MIYQLRLPGGRVAVEQRPTEPRVGQVIHDPSTNRRFRAVDGERPMETAIIRGRGSVLVTVVPVEEVTGMAQSGNSHRRFASTTFSGGAGRPPAVRG